MDRLKPRLKGWIKQICTGSGALRMAGRFGQARAVILMYHSIQDDPERYANSIGRGIMHDRSIFERQMELVRRKFSPVTVEDILLFLQEEKPLPRLAVAVTFDDGFADNLEIAAPILDRFGIRAAFYLTTGFIGTKYLPWFCRLRYAFAVTPRTEWLSPANGKLWSLKIDRDRNAALLSAFDLCSSMTGDALQEMIENIERELEVETLTGERPFMLDWNQARTLQRKGHILGCHTLTHPNVAHLDEALARAELLESKGRLEQELGVPVLHFSYPHPALNPHWTPATVRITDEGGYWTAVTTTNGAIRKGDDPLALTRIWTPFSERDFLWNLERSFLNGANVSDPSGAGTQRSLT